MRYVSGTDSVGVYIKDTETGKDEVLYVDEAFGLAEGGALVAGLTTDSIHPVTYPGEPLLIKSGKIAFLNRVEVHTIDGTITNVDFGADELPLAVRLSSFGDSSAFTLKSSWYERHNLVCFVLDDHLLMKSLKVKFDQAGMILGGSVVFDLSKVVDFSTAVRFCETIVKSLNEFGIEVVCSSIFDSDIQRLNMLFKECERIYDELLEGDYDEIYQLV